MPTRGRPSNIDKYTLINVIINYKDRVIIDNQKIISKTNAIWITIAKELNNRVTPISLYLMVSCNRYGLRDKLTDRASESPHQPMNVEHHVQEISNICTDSRNDSTINDSTINDSTINNSLLNISNININSVDGVVSFTFTMAKADFNAMIIQKTYRRREKGRPPSTREYTILQPGTWQQAFTERIWESANCHVDLISNVIN